MGLLNQEKDFFVGVVVLSSRIPSTYTNEIFQLQVVRLDPLILERVSECYKDPDSMTKN